MSEKLKMLYSLEENHYYFENVDINLFYILENIDTSELNLMKEEIFLVTPLLKQITNYALISLAIGEYEEEVLSLASSGELIDNILGFCRCCYNYLDCLLSEICLHPSVVNLINISSATKSYNLISDLSIDLINDLSDDIQESLIEFCDNVVENTDSIIDNSFSKIINFIEKNRFITEKQLLSLLTSYALDISRVLMLFEKEKEVYLDKNIVLNVLQNSKIKVVNDEGDEVFLSFGNSLNDFASLIKQIEKYLLLCNDFVVKEKLEKIKELYYLYIGYRYDYFKNDFLEQQMIEKCKKL